MGTPSLTEQRVSLRDGRTLGFAEFGDPNGDPVLEFHGCPGSRLEAWNYDEVGKKLGARVIGIDRPGFGISTYVKGYRIVDWPADVSEFADALGLERFAVAGIPSGSPYALASARFIPERLKGCAIVSGLSPLTVEGEKLDPSHYLMAEELLMARLAKTVPFAARAIFRQEVIAESARNGVQGPVESIGLELRNWGFSLQDITMPVSTHSTKTVM